MKKALSNIAVLVGVAALALLISAIASCVTRKWHWFARSGAIVTMAGVILSVRPLIRMGLPTLLKSQSIIDGGHVPPTAEGVEETRQQQRDATATEIGAVMAFVGTLIWAYGDLIGGIP
jgi:hypothetical protein